MTPVDRIGDAAGETARADAQVRTIGSTRVDVSTQSEAVERLKAAVVQGRTGVWGFCNAHTVNMAYDNAAFRGAVGQMTLFNDGVGLDIASKILYGAPFPENVNGTDLTPVLLDALGKMRIFLIGSLPGVAQEAANAMAKAHPDIVICGVQHGFFDEAEEDDIAKRIVASGAQLVLVGMGHPRQEIWAVRNSTAIPAPLLCVGAYIDRAAGKVARPPMLIRRLRCEWAYRLALEPRRLARRYLIGNAVFLRHILREKRTAFRN